MHKIYTICFVLLCFLAGGSCQKHPQKPVLDKKNSGFTNLGPQLTATAIQGSTFILNETGEELVYTVVRGKPAHLLGYDLKTNALISNLVLANTQGAWSMVQATDGWLYVGAENGSLFRHRPGSQELTDLGRPLDSEAVIWDLTAGKNGEIFGGTYNSCRVFRYHPNDGFSNVGRGALVAGELYVRSIVYHPESEKIYAGVGSHAHLIELDPKTGNKKEILPPKYQGYEFVYTLALVPGLSTGDRLVAWLNSSESKVTLIFNTRTGKLEQEMGTIDVKSVLKAPDSDVTYFLAKGQLASIDFSKPALTGPVVLKNFPGSVAQDMAWGIDNQLYLVDSKKRIIKYDLVTGNSTSVELAVPPQPIEINTMVGGPDGKIWSGGYLAGGHAAFHPGTAKTEEYPGLSQTEGMTVQGSHIYIGTYPGANIYAFDTRQPWDLKKHNPKLLGQIAGQDRPFAGVSAENQHKVFFGTVPGYGKLGGALVEYNTNTGKLKTFREVIPQQSVVSLAYADELVIGGTSISGGLGIAPTQTEAKLFCWDPKTDTKVFEAIPVSGAMAITSLINGPDGYVWGIADSTLFKFNPSKKEIVSRHPLYSFTKGAFTFRDAFLLVHPSGYVYGTGRPGFFRIDPQTMKLDLLQSGSSLLAMDKTGNIYIRRAGDLWQYRP